MKRFSRILGFGIIAAVAALGAHAQDKEEIYVPKVERTTLLEKPLAGSDGKSISINRFKLPAGYVGGKHSHSGPVFAYIQKGSIRVVEDDGTTKMFKAGQLLEEPIGKSMQASNASADGPTELLVIQVHDTGKPMMYKSK